MRKLNKKYGNISLDEYTRLKQRVEEELEATLEVLPPHVKQIGFYSYGEISPLTSGQCDLHNQTMTLTVMWEKETYAT